MANSVDLDETARYEPSHQDLHCLHRYWFCRTERIKSRSRENVITALKEDYYVYGMWVGGEEHLWNSTKIKSTGLH